MKIGVELMVLYQKQSPKNNQLMLVCLKQINFSFDQLHKFMNGVGSPFCGMGPDLEPQRHCVEQNDCTNNRQNNITI